MAESVKTKKKMLCRMHPDFHTPANAIVGEGFDAAEYIRKTKESNVDSQVFFAKCHYGFAYYPTEVGTVHPGLKCDMLGELARECKKQDVRLVVYESLFLDSAAGEQHPQWLPQTDPDNFMEKFEGPGYAPICVNSPYVDELFIPQTLEIMRKYDVEEFFFDTMCEFVPCYCDNCREKFGAEIPRNSDDPNWERYVKWYNDCYNEFFEKIINAVHEEDENVEVYFNWKWSARIPENPPKGIRRLAGDLHPLAAEASYNSHYWAGTGMEFEYMCGRFMHGLGDWTTNTLTTLKAVASSTIANGGGFYLIDRQLPDGRLEDRAWDAAKEVFGFVQNKRPFLENTKHVPEIAVLFSVDHIVGANYELFPDRKKREEQVEVHRGISEILRINGIHYTALNEPNLLKNIDAYKLVILPETQFISAKLREGLKQYAERGGKVLLVNCDDKELLGIAGAKYIEKNDCEYVYATDYENGERKNYPFVVRGGQILAEKNENALTGEEDIWPNVGAPMPIGDEHNHYGHGFAPYGGDTEYPAFVMNKGKNVGAVLLPIIRSYFSWHEPNLANYIINRIYDLCPDLMVKLDTAALVEKVLLRQENDLIINLVNHSGRETLAAYWCPIVEYMPMVVDAKLSLEKELFANAANGVLEVEDCDTGATFKVSVDDTCNATFDVPQFDIMCSFRVKNVF